MPTTLTNGIQLPDKGSVDWYNSMQSNYNLIDTHLGNTDTHVTAEDKANWNSKQGSLSQAQLDAIAQVSTNTSDIATLQSGKANVSHTHSSSDITDIGDYATKQYVDNSISGLVDNAPDALNTLNELSAALNDDSNFASTVATALSAKANSADLATVATSGSYNDLSNKPTINDSTITIQKNGNLVGTFTVNGSAKTIDIPVPTKTSDLTNDSNFVDTSNSAVASGITSAKVTSYDSHVADTDIHVTTADKTKWNNGVSQSYVLRYSSSSVTDNSTIAFSTLDNTDNVKSGDKVIDVDGKIFSIVSVDTANQTVTVGSALIDLALDANVVHTSGNETVGGIKNFSDEIYVKNINFTREVASTSVSTTSILQLINTVTYTDQTADKVAILNFRVTADGVKAFYPNENNQYSLGLQSRKWSEVRAIQYYYGSSDTEFSDKFVTTDMDQTISGTKRFDNLVSLYGSYLGDEGSNNARTCSYSFSNRDTIGFSGVYQRRVRQNREQGQMSGSDISQYAFDILENQVRTNNVLYFVGRDFTNDIPKTMYIASQCNTRKLGSSLYPWSDTITNQINGLEPSSLGMPDLSNGIDISSYIPALDSSGNTQGSYTPNVNGFIVFRGIGNGCSIVQGNMGNNVSYVTDPQTSNRIVNNFLPVVKDNSVVITIRGLTSIEFIYFYPCQGNV